MASVDIRTLVDKKFFRVEQIGDEAIEFENDDGVYKMHHIQDCCEEVSIESIVGELKWLENTPILVAEKVTSDENPKIKYEDINYGCGSFTWTFYKLVTLKGYIDIRWWGESNGYYSEEVDIEFMPRNETYDE